ncbi:MAG: lipopolysaccharide heptosyltransferase II [Myxococcota bacterium]
MAASREKIAVLLPNHLGDVVMATPALRSLREGFPDAHLTAVVRHGLEAMLARSPRLDVLRVHRVYESRLPGSRSARRLGLALTLDRPDRVVLLPNSFSSALVAWASGARQRVGYARRGRGWLLTDPVAPPTENGRFVPLAMERYYLDLVTHLGCPDRGTALELFVELEGERERERRLAESGLDPSRPLVCLAPGAGFGPSKLWPPRYFAQVARALLADGLQVALVHGPDETRLASAVVEAAGRGLACLGGGGMTLTLLKSLLAHAALLICNDAGARHVAAAFGTPCLVLMGPTSVRYTNLNLERTRLLREPVECSPCQRPVCPIDHRCMTRLSPERVLREARAALGDASWRGSLDLELAR